MAEIGDENNLNQTYFVIACATNPNDMACMFNKYFELASYNNSGESLAVVVR